MVPLLAVAPPEGVTADRSFVIVDDTITFCEGDETQLIQLPSGISATAVSHYSFMGLEDLRWLCVWGKSQGSSTAALIPWFPMLHKEQKMWSQAYTDACAGLQAGHMCTLLEVLVNTDTWAGCLRQQTPP